MACSILANSSSSFFVDIYGIFHKFSPAFPFIKHLRAKMQIAIKIRKAAKIMNRYNQVPHLTQDTTWESDKNTINHHNQESSGQQWADA